MKLDFTNFDPDAEPSSYKPALGWHKVEIDGYDEGKSEKKQTPFLGLTFRGLEAPSRDKFMHERLYITEKALARFYALFKAVEMPYVKGEMTVDPKDLLHKKLWVHMVEKRNEDSMRKIHQVDFRGFMHIDESPEPRAEVTAEAEIDVPF